jgi:hypothetical protein
MKATPKTTYRPSLALCGRLPENYGEKVISITRAKPKGKPKLRGQ